MKTPISGLRAGILTQLVFLIAAAMFLINIVILNFYEKDLLKAKELAGRLLILSIENSMGFLLQNGDVDPDDLKTNTVFNKAVMDMLNKAEYYGVTIVNSDGILVFSAGFSDENNTSSRMMAMNAVVINVDSVSYTGRSWGIFWPENSEVSLSSPIRRNGKVTGGISVTASLAPLYQNLRNSEKLIIIYILIDTVILALAGIYLLSRLVVNPVHRLLRMTEEYSDTELISSAGELPSNEIGNLSSALSNMLEKLDENKRELKSHIVSLEKANNELRSAQKEIIRSEKLASVGRLAAGIAHEIGNPIGIILGYIDLIQKGGLTPDEEKDFLSRVESEISRVNVIIRQLLDFSRSSSGKTEKFSLHDLIKVTIDMLAPKLKSMELDVLLELNAEKDEIIADKNQLQQLFLNILMNSIDALEAIDTKQENPGIVIKSESLNTHFEISFTDKGPGISPDELGRIFDPFFTTKEPGRGTGLGLSVCYRIVEELGGEIEAESLTGAGMKIRIELPFDQGNSEEPDGDCK